MFSLFALAAGILRFSGREQTNPLLKAVVDDAVDGVLVTDPNGRVIYANAAYLDLVGAASAHDVRPVERVFIGDPDVSEAVYRLLKAAREGRRVQEEVRVAAGPGEAGRWLRLRVRPLRRRHARAALTVWSIADVTRERERQENVFQELQHAIDYLDHAPAGFFSVDAKGHIVYLNATLADWLDHDLAQVGSGGLKLADIVSGEGAALLTTFTAAPGEVKTEVFDLDLKTRTGKPLPVRLFHKVAFGADGAPGASRTLVLNRARDAARMPQRAAEVRFMRFFQHTPMAIATVDKAGQIARTNARFAARVRGPAQGRRALDPRGRRRARPRRARSRDRQGGGGQGDIAPVDAALGGRGERWASFFVSAVEEADRDGEAAIVYALETTDQRTLENARPAAAEDGVGRPARRRHRARFQQRALRHHDGDRFPAQRAQADRSVVPGHHADQAERQPRRARWCGSCWRSRGEQTLRPQVLDLGEVLGDLGMLLQRLIGEKVTLEVKHGRDLWPVKADLSQFEQVIVNLAVNARDAMPDGGKLTRAHRQCGGRGKRQVRLQGHAARPTTCWSR